MLPMLIRMAGRVTCRCTTGTRSRFLVTTWVLLLRLVRSVRVRLMSAVPVQLIGVGARTWCLPSWVMISGGDGG